MTGAVRAVLAALGLADGVDAGGRLYRLSGEERQQLLRLAWATADDELARALEADDPGRAEARVIADRAGEHAGSRVQEEAGLHCLGEVESRLRTRLREEDS